MAVYEAEFKGLVYLALMGLHDISRCIETGFFNGSRGLSCGSSLLQQTAASGV